MWQIQENWWRDSNSTWWVNIRCLFLQWTCYQKLDNCRTVAYPCKIIQYVWTFLQPLSPGEYRQFIKLCSVWNCCGKSSNKSSHSGRIKEDWSWCATLCFFQEEVTEKKAEATCGTFTAAVVNRNSCAQGLIISSCFDQKPFYMISNVATKVGWKVVPKKVFSHSDSKTIIYTPFSISDNYNFQMNYNDITHQLHLDYHMMNKSRYNKWWWTLFQKGGCDVYLVNKYCMYSCYHGIFWSTSEYSHYDFVYTVAQV